MKFYLKTERGTPAEELDDATASRILNRGRHQGRRVVEVFILRPDGAIDRCTERARRKLGSNAIVSRTWLCETHEAGADGEWSDERYVQNPEEAIEAVEPAADAVMLVLLGAEDDSAANVEQLLAVKAGS